MEKHNYTYQSDFAKKHLAEGCRILLREPLQQRFGELPEDAEARIEKADADTLTAWGRKLLNASNLADVFAPA